MPTNLLAAIQAGKKLKKVDHKKVAKAKQQAAASPRKGAGKPTMQDQLRMAMARRRAVLTRDSTDEDSDSDDD